ncbi:MAG: hypothetical protein GY866_26845 [Proteobacteria bacterium]|nr:hypothetical protein [Pseudomonadota bacterium]
MPETKETCTPALKKNAVAEMCRIALSTTDIKAICKTRSFSSNVAESSDLLQHYFLSETGLESAFATLTREEIVTLHLLRHLNSTVDIEFFDRLYHKALPGWHTYTQKNQPLFKEVQKNLIRKGILVYYLARLGVWSDEKKMERYRFLFPDEFVPFLPPVLEGIRTFRTKGNSTDGMMRKKLKEIVVESKKPAADRLRISDRKLLFGERTFSARRLANWQIQTWQIKSDIKAKSKKESPLSFLDAAFSKLDDNEWFPPEAFTVPLSLFLNTRKTPNTDTICEMGWKCGILAKHRHNGKLYYRFLSPPESQAMDPSTFLSADKTGSLAVDLEHVPLEALDRLAGISLFEIVGGTVVVEPDFIGIGREYDKVVAHPLTQWLDETIPAFAATLKKCRQTMGKQIVHQNLMIAKVKDLGLKVKILKGIKDKNKLVQLSDDYIAFPIEMRKKIEKMVAASGHVVKTIEVE